MSHHDSDTPPPAEVCATCDTRRAWRSWVSWLRWLVPMLVAVLMALGSGYVSLHFLARSAAAEASHLRESRTDDRAEVQRLSAAVVQRDRDAAVERAAQAERWREVSSALARIEARLDAMEQQRRR